MSTTIINAICSAVPLTEDLIGIGLSFILWNVLNYIVQSMSLTDGHLKRNEMLDMRNRIVSFFHGSSMLIFAGYHTYFLHSDCGASSTSLERNIIVTSCGYFLYDFVAMAYYGLLDKGMCIHHISCVLIFVTGLSQGNSASLMINAVFAAEISNPIMQVRMVLKHMGFRHTKAYEVSELTYIMLFIYGRIILGTPVILKTLMCSQNNFLIKLSAVAIIFQSYFYIYYMIIILKIRANEYSNRKRFSVKMYWLTSLTSKQIELLGLNRHIKRKNENEKIIP